MLIGHVGCFRLLVILVLLVPLVLLVLLALLIPLVLLLRYQRKTPSSLFSWDLLLSSIAEILARSSQRQPEAAESSQEQPEAARSSQEQPGAGRSSQGSWEWATRTHGSAATPRHTPKVTVVNHSSAIRSYIENCKTNLTPAVNRQPGFHRGDS
jgi:hypothetical protein